MTIETFAEKVANEVLGESKPTEGASDYGAVNWAALIEMVVKIVTQLLASCPAKQNKVLDGIKRPTLLGRARFGSLVFAMTRGNRCCEERSDAIEQAMRKVAASMKDGELLSVVFQVQNDDWSVI